MGLAWGMCYLLPYFVIGGLIAAALGRSGDASSGGWTVVLMSYFVVYFVGMPVSAGYFTARFAKNRPLLHVLVVAAVAAAAFWLVTNGELPVQAVTFVASVLFAFLGALVAMRGGVRGEA